MRKHLFVAAVAALLSACATIAGASTITVTWDNPTDNTDSSLIPATQGAPEALQTWRIEYGTCVGSAFGTKAGEFTRTRAVGGPPLTTATNNVPTGLTCVRVLVANTAGNESSPSNVASRTVAPSTPKNPTNAVAL